MSKQLPYTMKTTTMFEHSRGIFWSADLLLDGRKVGIIEQHGRGGADRVLIHTYDDRRAWARWVEDEFNCREEDATYALLCAEEKVTA
jgi:hypothetical protein